MDNGGGEAFVTRRVLYLNAISRAFFKSGRLSRWKSRRFETVKVIRGMAVSKVEIPESPVFNENWKEIHEISVLERPSMSNPSNSSFNGFLADSFI